MNEGRKQRISDAFGAAAAHYDDHAGPQRFAARLVADLAQRQAEAQPDAPPMDTFDVADAARSVLHMAELPLEANVQFMTVMATKMPYIGRG